MAWVGILRLFIAADNCVEATKEKKEGGREREIGTLVGFFRRKCAYEKEGDFYANFTFGSTQSQHFKMMLVDACVACNNGN